MESTFEEEELFSNVKEEIIDPEEEQTQLAMGKDENSLVEEEAIDASEVKEEAEGDEIEGYGGCAARKELECYLSRASRKRKWPPGVERNNYATKQDVKEEVEPTAAFNAHTFLSNEDLLKERAQGGGLTEFEDVNGEKEEEEEVTVDHVCPVDGCPMWFSSSYELIVHMKNHPTPLLCGGCKGHYATAATLRQHYKMHTGQKPFKCGVCEKKFPDKSTLKKHQRIHTGERTQECDECGYKTFEPSSLREHKRTHSGERPFPCTVCGKSFIRSCHLARHLRTHGECQYECDNCGYKASTQSDLNRHLRIHSVKTVKTFSCTVCEKQFPHLYTLNIHMRKHTGERPYKCELCEFTATVKSTLKAHLKIHTGVRR